MDKQWSFFLLQEIGMDRIAVRVFFQMSVGGYRQCEREKDTHREKERERGVWV